VNWDAIGAIAEAAGAVAVIGSVMYLALQIRQNTLSNRLAAKQDTADQFAEYTRFLLANPALRGVLYRGRESMSNLNAEERDQFHLLNQHLYWNYSSQFYQYRQGALDEDEWAESLGLIRSSWMEHPGTREWWRDFDRRRVSRAFGEFIDRQIAEIEGWN